MEDARIAFCTALNLCHISLNWVNNCRKNSDMRGNVEKKMHQNKKNEKKCQQLLQNAAYWNFFPLKRV